MTRAIRNLRNLGPKTERMLAEVDIFDEADLRALGALEAYRRLKFRFGWHVTLIALYAMAAALADCDWRRLDSATRNRLRKAAGSI